MGWVSLGWSLALLAWVGTTDGITAAWHLGWHTLLTDYLPFVTMLGSLYVVAGGVQIRGGPSGTPLGNTLTLMLGMVLGLVMGPTGAAVVVIHPFLAANAHRRRRVHLVLFLIILVANISGALTPLGNPPLFAGLLRGVPFLWPARFLLLPYLTLTCILMCAFYALDRILAASEPPARRGSVPRVRGWLNLGLIAVLGASVMLQTIDLGTLTLFGAPVGVARLGASLLAVFIGWLSWRITPRARRRANDFTWHPMVEVAVLFAGIFVTLAPISHLLQSGSIQTLVPALQAQDGQQPALAYFWLAGLLSAFLDNAPTYLVFFDMARIDPAHPGPLLVAISAGAVFFGGLTYIGNAPNLMLRGIASHRGVRMPAFGLYLAMAAAVLIPAFVLLTAIFFWQPATMLR